MRCPGRQELTRDSDTLVMVAAYSLIMFLWNSGCRMRRCRLWSSLGDASNPLPLNGCTAS
ncbi:Uncharacterised protein [Mycobacteroides abscessus subsp. massiliense]|nr:Uncharacterised protein [Mycobacteroides abscessus subsp. massiliense]